MNHGANNTAYKFLADIITLILSNSTSTELCNFVALAFEGASSIAGIYWVSFPPQHNDIMACIVLFWAIIASYGQLHMNLLFKKSDATYNEV